MKKRQRKQYSADLKAKVALETIKGQRTIQEIASHYGIHPNMVTNWKKQLPGRSRRDFFDGAWLAREADEQLKAKFHQQIGKLQVNMDWLKKAQSVPVKERLEWIDPTNDSSISRQSMLAG